jgi:hypothetical protein
MDTAISEQTTVAEEAVTQLLRWRYQQLCRAGFEPEDATVLATHTAVDLHRALDLVQRGCPPKLALQILL